MNAIIDLWICTDFKPTFRCGGWAFIRPGESGLMASAGGLRRATGDEILLGALMAGLSGLEGKAPQGAETISLRSAPAERKNFAALLARLAGKGDPQEPPIAPELRDAVLRAINKRGLRLGPPMDADEPTLGFLTAWAELAREKATASGAFTASIPKANLAKVAGFVGA